MGWFKPKLPMVNLTSDPDRHIKLNRLAIFGTPAQSDLRAGRERQREFILWDIAVCMCGTPKIFANALLNCLIRHIPSASKDTAKSTSWLFSTGLRSRKGAHLSVDLARPQ